MEHYDTIGETFSEKLIGVQILFLKGISNIRKSPGPDMIIGKDDDRIMYYRQVEVR